LFISLAGDHEELIEALPTSPTAVISRPVTQTSRTEHWRRLLRTASARKFIVQKSDEVYLAKVFDSAEACMADSVTDRMRRLQPLRDLLQEVSTGSIGEYFLGDEEPATEPDIMADVLYGRVLHGDYHRWIRSERRQSTGWEVSTAFFWLNEAEGLIAATRKVVLDGIELGHIDLNSS
jgi:hypothetical protein